MNYLFVSDKPLSVWTIVNGEVIKLNNEPKVLSNEPQVLSNEPQVLFNNSIELKENTIKLNNISQQKIELQHNINILKMRKKKIEEYKLVFKNDLILFDLFSEKLHKDSFFVIPELFDKKFKLITKIKHNNNLSWDTFYDEYYHEDVNKTDIELFKPNNYEKKFINCKSDDTSLNEEIEIIIDLESDSNKKSDTYSNNHMDNNIIII